MAAVVRRAGRPRESGLSLIEFLVAAFVLAIGILGLTMLQAFSLRVTGQEVGNNRAALLAEGVLDEIQARARARNVQAQVDSTVPDDTLFTGTASSRSYSRTGERLQSSTGRFYTVAIRRTALSTPAMPLPGLSRFEVEVSYTADVVGPPGSPKSITRTVLLSRKVSHV